MTDLIERIKADRAEGPTSSIRRLMRAQEVEQALIDQAERLELYEGRVVGDGPVKSVEAGLVSELTARVELQAAEIERLRETNRTLHRRTQMAESIAYRKAGRWKRKVERAKAYSGVVMGCWRSSSNKLSAENKRLRDFLAAFAADTFPATRHFSGPSPEDELDETTPLAPVEAWQDEARATLQEDKTYG